MTRHDVDVAIVGGGPAGLAAALELRRRGVGRVLVAEREAQAGGVPRHANHHGFGLRDLRRVLSGPAYAKRYVDRAVRADVDVRIAATVTEWAGPTALALTTPAGLVEVRAQAVLLATGCRERPRAARLVPGSRPLGVLTTGALQQLVYLGHQRVGRRAVVVGAEHVSFSALVTLADGGVRAVAMVTEHPRHQTWAPFRWATASVLRVPILTSSRVTRIVGRQRVEGVEVTDAATGTVRMLECDTVVFTGDWIPDHELARRGDLAMDGATRAPVVDGMLRTSRPGVFAAGNLLHAAETADTAALSGRVAARSVHDHLSGRRWPDHAPTPVVCAAPVLWASPSAVVPGETALPHGGLVLRVGTFGAPAALVVRQGARVLWRGRARRFVPNRSIRARIRWREAVDPNGGPLVVALER